MQLTWTSSLSIVILLSSHIHSIFGFSLSSFSRTREGSGWIRSAPRALSAEASIQDAALSCNINVTLNKPLGVILTELDDNSPGILISEVNPTGSAYSSPFKEQLIGAQIISVNNMNVQQMMFDDIMDLIASSESPVNLMVLPPLSESNSITSEPEPDTTSPTKAELPMGSSVQLTVTLAGESTSKIIDAKVGDNLRKTLLDNGVELYRGWKKKLGNCGGGGQCTFCAVDVLDTEGYWEPRSEYEESKIGRKMSANGRLACLNNIPGPADIVIPP